MYREMYNPICRATFAKQIVEPVVVLGQLFMLWCLMKFMEKFDIFRDKGISDSGGFFLLFAIK